MNNNELGRRSLVGARAPTSAPSQKADTRPLARPAEQSKQVLSLRRKQASRSGAFRLVAFRLPLVGLTWPPVALRRRQPRAKLSMKQEISFRLCKVHAGCDATTTFPTATKAAHSEETNRRRQQQLRHLARRGSFIQNFSLRLALANTHTHSSSPAI